MIIVAVPLDELPHADLEVDLRTEPEVAGERRAVGERDRDVAALHREEFAVGFEVVIGGKEPRADELALKRGDELRQRFGAASPDVVQREGRHGEPVLAGLSRGSALHHAVKALRHVVDVGKVAFAAAVIEDLDGSAPDERVGGGVVEHVGPAGGAVDREESQPGDGNLVELGVGMRHELVALLRGGIERNRGVRAVGHGERDLRAVAVDGRTRGKDEVFHAGRGAVRSLAAGFEDVEEAHDVRKHVHVRVVDGVAHAGLRGEVHDHGRAEFGEDALDEGFVRDVALAEGPGRGARGRAVGDETQAVLLQRGVVVVVQVVDADDMDPVGCREQTPHQGGADESGGPGDENGLVVQFDPGFHGGLAWNVDRGGGWAASRGIKNILILKYHRFGKSQASPGRLFPPQQRTHFEYGYWQEVTNI